jgi:hypothetical protein
VVVTPDERERMGQRVAAQISGAFGLEITYRAGELWLSQADWDALVASVGKLMPAGTTANTLAGYPFRIIEGEPAPEVASPEWFARRKLAHVILTALKAAGESDFEYVKSDDLGAVVLDGTFDLLAVGDAIVTAVHAEQDQTVRRMLERSPWASGSATHEVYRRKVLGDWLNDEPDGLTPEAVKMLQGRLTPRGNGFGLAARITHSRPPLTPEDAAQLAELIDPPVMERWRCVVVGCNPVLDQSTAQTHATDEGHRVAKWPVRSEAGQEKAAERNRSGYYDRYNQSKGRRS